MLVACLVVSAGSRDSKMLIEGWAGACSIDKAARNAIGSCLLACTDAVIRCQGCERRNHAAEAEYRQVGHVIT